MPIAFLLEHAADLGRSPKRPSFLTVNAWASGFLHTPSNRPVTFAAAALALTNILAATNTAPVDAAIAVAAADVIAEFVQHVQHATPPHINIAVADNTNSEFDASFINSFLTQINGSSYAVPKGEADAVTDATIPNSAIECEAETIPTSADVLHFHVFDPGGGHCRASAAAYFLIPLRGSKCYQWNEEVEDAEEAVMKKKIKRRLMMRHK